MLLKILCDIIYYQYLSVLSRERCHGCFHMLFRQAERRQKSDSLPVAVARNIKESHVIFA